MWLEARYGVGSSYRDTEWNTAKPLTTPPRRMCQLASETYNLAGPIAAPYNAEMQTTLATR